MKNRTVLWLAIGAVALAGVFSAGDAQAREGLVSEPVIRGEQARLLRQWYDYAHRNSNDNVYRNSRHHHPTRNVFRSSRHYKRRVEASSDGFPLRTFVRFGRSIGGGDLKPVEFSFAHHRRQPYGLPTVRGTGLTPAVYGNEHGYGYDDDCGRSDARAHRAWRHYGSHYDGDVQRRDAPGLEAQPQFKVITPDGMVVNAAFENGDEPATQEAVIRQVEGDDGSVRTVITNPGAVETDSAGSLDDAWAAVTDGDYDAAQERFKDLFMHEQQGAEAMIGYGIAALLAGDEQDARTAFDRAQRIDEDVLSQVRLSGVVREALRAAADDVEDEIIATAVAKLVR